MRVCAWRSLRLCLHLATSRYISLDLAISRHTSQYLAIISLDLARSRACAWRSLRFSEVRRSAAACSCWMYLARGRG